VPPQTLAYLSLAFAFAITPGATTTVVIRHTLEGGWRRGLIVSAGAQVASAIQASLALVGVGLLVLQFPDALKLLGYGGAVFILWIGLKSLRAALRAPARASDQMPRNDFAVPRRATPLRDGFIVNILNPSITSFYLGVVPTFVPAGSTWRVAALFYAIHITIAFLCHAFWASLLNHAREFFSGGRPRRWLDATVGVLLLYLAARIAGRAWSN
jgi:threonine/homoserine/homoserine lactone efflux protein